MLSRDRSSPAAVGPAADRNRARRLRTRPVLEQLGGPGSCAVRPRQAVGRPAAGRGGRPQRGGRALPARRRAGTRRSPTTPSPTTGNSPNSPCARSRWRRWRPDLVRRCGTSGAGSGSVAIEWCRSGTGCRAVAFERDEAGAGADHRKCRGVRRARRRVGWTRPARSSVAQAPSVIFVGGGLSQPGVMDACWERFPSAAGWSPTPSPLSPKPLLAAMVFRGSVANCEGSSTTAASRRLVHRLAAGDAGDPVVSGQAVTVYR